MLENYWKKLKNVEKGLKIFANFWKMLEKIVKCRKML